MLRTFNMKKLNLGCGTDIKKDYINLDIVPLKGVDVVSNLSAIPYPFKSNTFGEIQMRHVLEHLPNVLETMEELYRISTSGGSVMIAVPYWNSYGAVVDPTHKSFFHQRTFDYFDPSKKLCQSKGFYTLARFKIGSISYIHESKLLQLLQKIVPLKNKNGNYKIPGQFRVRGKISKWILEQFAHYFCNIINSMEIHLIVLKTM